MCRNQFQAELQFKELNCRVLAPSNRETAANISPRVDSFETAGGTFEIPIKWIFKRRITYRTGGSPGPAGAVDVAVLFVHGVETGLSGGRDGALRRRWVAQVAAGVAHHGTVLPRLRSATRVFAGRWKGKRQMRLASTSSKTQNGLFPPRSDEVKTDSPLFGLRSNDTHRPRHWRVWTAANPRPREHRRARWWRRRSRNRKLRESHSWPSSLQLRKSECY